MKLVAAAGIYAAAHAALAAAPSAAGHVFLPNQANQARELAQTMCKPLVVHVVPNSSVGYTQMLEFYGAGGEMPPEVLDRVIIVILPRDRYAKFSSELGITDAGGMRTISPFSLDTMDASSVTTCRAGFV